LWYDQSRFDEPEAARIAGYYQALLQGALQNPDAHVGALPMLPESERNQLLVEWNATDKDFGSGTILSLFDESVRSSPDATAVVFEQESLTYAGLDRKTNKLANHLRKHGVGPDVAVGLCLDRSVDLIVGLLGILKAGGAYVPLDP